MNKKGQVTLFIILGIVLLLASALMIYVKDQISSKDFEDLVGNTPTEVRPVQEFIENCMYNVGKQAITLIGESGGYIEMNTSLISIVPNKPTMSDGVELVPGTDIVVPYWFHMSDANDCQSDCSFDISLIPELAKEEIDDLSIENQISGYIEDNLPGCFDDFNSFQEVGMIVTGADNLIVDTVITSKEVKTRLKYPINISYEGRVVNMELFQQSYDVKLLYSYLLARLLVLQETDTYFFEQSLANLITSFGGVNKIIPPMYGDVDFSAGASEFTWNQNEVTNHLKNILHAYVPNLKVARTYDEFRMGDVNSEDQWSDTINKMNYLVYLDYDLNFPLDVEFMYMPNWNIYTEINPKENGKISPISGDTPFLSYVGFGITRYQFSYDVSYPVVVKIHDPSAFNNEGYDFYFAIEANMRNNKALFVPVGFDTQVSDPEPANLCQQEGKNTGNITIKAVDYLSDDTISDVSIYSTFSDSGCEEGKTGDDGIYTNEFQTGIGYLTLKKKDYLTSQEVYVFGIDKTDYKEVVMYPKNNINLKVSKQLLVKTLIHNNFGYWDIGGKEDFDLTSPTESVVVQLTRQKDADSRSTNNEVFMFTEDFSGKEIGLYPGRYDVEITYFNSRLYTIPSSEIDDTKIEAMNSSLQVLYKLEGENGLLITPEDLYDNNQLNVRILVPDVYKEQASMTTSDLEVLSKIDLIVDNYYEFLKPELVKI